VPQGEEAGTIPQSEREVFHLRPAVHSLAVHSLAMSLLATSSLVAS
jgi:hypothetical protein